MSATAIQRPQDTGGPRSSIALAFDPLIFLAAIGLIVCSYVTLHGSGNGSYANRQLVYAALGLVLAVILSSFDYTILRHLRYPLYGLTLLLNIVVFAFHGANGATRWIPLPFFQLQPSEFGKVLMVLVLAAFAVERARSLSQRRLLVQLMLLALVPAMLVIKQPDLGTGIVYIVIAVAILFFAGVGWKYFAGLLALFVVAATLVMVVAPAIGVHVLKTYQEQRLETLINPSSSCSSGDHTCYQLQQSLTAIGSGGKVGRGVAGATQTQLDFLPEEQNDFIFAVIGETYGFAGAAVILALYALLVWRVLRVVAMAKNLFGTLIAGGVLAMLIFQVFLNIGSVTGIMPVTGVPLPLLSYGGSSVIVTLMSLGLVQSVHVQARLTNAGKTRVQIV
jgi:rod shape determining protein RodA